jgi:hypothetical protein
VVRQLLPAAEAEEVLGQRSRCYYLLCKMTALMQEARGCMPQYAARRLDFSISTLTAVVRPAATYTLRSSPTYPDCASMQLSEPPTLL